jgi:hypothetical protein
MKKPTGCFITGSPFLVGVPIPKPNQTTGPWLVKEDSK